MKTRQLNKHFSDFALWLFIAGATSLLGEQAKPQAKPEVKPGVISGRVFLITQAGDIKPARMADVKLFYASDPSVPIAEAGKDKNSAAYEWFVELNKTLSADIEEGDKVRKALEDAERESKSADKHERREAAKNLPIARANLHARVASACPRRLLLYTSALGETVKWVFANMQEKGWQYISEQADEEGRFSMKVPNPGRYVLIVTGRAGLNDAVWGGCRHHKPRRRNHGQDGFTNSGMCGDGRLRRTTNSILAARILGCTPPPLVPRQLGLQGFVGHPHGLAK